MVVDRSLSRGLADRVLADIAHNSASYKGALAQIVPGNAHKRGDIERKASELLSLGESSCLTQILGNHPKWRWLQLTAFVPSVCKLEGYGADNRTVAYFVIRIYIHVDRRPLADLECPMLLGLQEHAVERMFQRLNVLSPASVQEEIHDSMCLSLPASAACRALGLAQVLLPTRSGAFLCSVRTKDGLIVAKTWLSREDMQPRHREVVEAVESHYANSGGETGVAEALATIPVTVPLRAISADENLRRALDRFSWLREAYVPRPDPEGEAWRRATQQASAH